MARTREAVLEACIERDELVRERPVLMHWWQMSTKLGLAEVLAMRGQSDAN